MKPKLIVCGDSWMTPDRDKMPNTHFSELFAQKYGYDLVGYARGGMSNGGIALQIEQAIRDKPALILFGTTVIDRIELSLDSNEIRDRYVNKCATAEDLVYYAISRVKTKTPIISDNLVSFLNGSVRSRYPQASDPEEKDNAIKQWFMHMYSPVMKRKIDLWCMRAVLHKLHISGIPALLVIDSLEMPAEEVPWYSCITKDTYQQNYRSPLNSGWYHTLPEEQLKILDIVTKHTQLLGLT